MLGSATQPGGVGGTFLQAGLLGSLEVRGHVASLVEIDRGLKSLEVRGSLLGGNTAFSGAIAAGEDHALSYDGEASLGKVTIRGPIRGGSGAISASIPGGTDAFGFVAQPIHAFRHTKRVVARASIALDPVVTIGATLDGFVREL